MTSGPMQQRIHRRGIADLSPEHFELINESHRHSGPATESHFKLILASPQLIGLNAVKRHQLVYQVLSSELKDGVHALAMHLYTPEEWSEKGGAVAASPDCRGGSLSG